MRYSECAKGVRAWLFIVVAKLVTVLIAVAEVAALLILGLESMAGSVRHAAGRPHLHLLMAQAHHLLAHLELDVRRGHSKAENDKDNRPPHLPFNS